MNYRKAVSKKEVISIVDGVKKHGENVSVKEDYGGESEFMRHVRLDNQTRSIAGKTYDGKIALVSRKADGNHVKYTSNVITKSDNLVKAMREGLSFKKLKKGKTGRKHGKSTRRQGSRKAKQGKHSAKKGKLGRKHGKSGRRQGKSGKKKGNSGKNSKKNKSSGKSKTQKKKKSRK